MHGTYVNLAAAIDILAEAYREEEFNRWRADLGGSRALHSLSREFTAGISYAIGMMLDADTAAIIEAAAKERAQ